MILMRSSLNVYTAVHSLPLCIAIRANRDSVSLLASTEMRLVSHHRNWASAKSIPCLLALLRDYRGIIEGCLFVKLHKGIVMDLFFLGQEIIFLVRPVGCIKKMASKPKLTRQIKRQCWFCYLHSSLGLSGFDRAFALVWIKNALTHTQVIRGRLQKLIGGNVFDYAFK